MVDNGKTDLFLEMQTGFPTKFLEHLLSRVHQHTKTSCKTEIKSPK